ncbi:MAG: bacteriohemerythrin [Betaproteobacteria bacterium]|nr:bacteriohemerythrin [Betaproteobacteria bacterium]
MSQDLFHWHDEFSIGLKEIDEQHKELVRLLNALHEAIHSHRGSATCRKILDSLAAYTVNHFAVEESLMRVSGYPGFESHKKDHEDLVSQVVALQEKLDAGQAKISFELLHFLKQWLMHHIVGADKRFGDYFLAAGGQPSGSDEFKAALKEHKPWWKFW